MMDKQLLLDTLAGYARANEIIKHERAERLAALTQKQARAIARDLQESWESSANAGEELDRLEFRRVQTLLNMRRAFAALTRAQGLL